MIVAGLVALGLSTRRRRRRQRPGAATTETATGTERTPRTEAKATPAPPKRVALRVVPSTPTYVCVDRGAGTEVTFEGTLDAAADLPREAAARATSASATWTFAMNGKRVPVEPGPDPVGFEFTPERTRELPARTSVPAPEDRS